ncbi:Catalyzes the transfer of endogenously produced octanoic acid from octanoyl-acyl-carrier-protein onto the lipoyl domains of lipoate-dependent enzymes. Lipoyl-ACP can also act as a substrate although octanoyl-ACP is likely to be the physiological substrate [Vibrio sp. B1FIG11]|nr:Catalyzes the transfer of endogenously produced octanoic acid from octanoyl-acyl-carrier-protein onto the lipoyl domains of lipoate-dependent enzymes. Lipoyl-ACP can also act as a substrate although octanoyl-ACP is likely to be the physiological substrate [Vibrio sp. B1FIG11]CAE6889215.1 Catalyzes the transfer of endogenously produced octanoic acid from octanoyl-acyl-carrier-protein onto the lipoyl domains of lipoate-dependent enzymes. Lipoyl-ACP can also act as a substrate although octanoyl-AC
MQHQLVVKRLGRQDYEPVWKAMHEFTDQRTDDTPDEVWLVEHNPVFTQGQAGKAEHLINTGDIPVVQSDRGGQVTYHGPGQLVAYFLINLRRKKLGVRDLVTHIENLVINTLKAYNIDSAARPDAPGVYVDGKKNMFSRTSHSKRMLIPRPSVERQYGLRSVFMYKPMWL